MKKIILALILLCIFTPALSAADKAKDSNQLFYSANASYEKREYAEALEKYMKILDMGLESGNIYYNIGNGFLKLGRMGYAILCYEKAKRLIPGDSDLRANLNYAESLVEYIDIQGPPRNFVIRALERPFRSLNLNSLTVFIVAFYLIVIVISSIYILNPVFARKAAFPFVLIVTLFLFSAAAFMLRYYNEEILKYGIVIQKEADCKYEPIDKSTTYYRLYEGNAALILETRNGWRRIKRPDGKIAWVNKDALEEI